MLEVGLGCFNWGWFWGYECEEVERGLWWLILGGEEGIWRLEGFKVANWLRECFL